MSKIVAEVSSGKGFFVGDICYVLSDALYRGVWGEKHEYQDGTFSDPKTGLLVAVAGTYLGDGCYNGSDDSMYPVDAGVIGLVPLELVDDEDDAFEKGRVIGIPGTAHFEGENGVFTIRAPDGEEICIDTRPAE